MTRMPMTTAAHRPQETLHEMIDRIRDAGVMSKEDAQRVLEASASTDLFEYELRFLVQQAIAVKLAGM